MLCIVSHKNVKCPLIYCQGQDRLLCSAAFEHEKKGEYNLGSGREKSTNYSFQFFQGNIILFRPISVLVHDVTLFQNILNASKLFNITYFKLIDMDIKQVSRGMDTLGIFSSTFLSKGDDFPNFLLDFLSNKSLQKKGPF